MDSENSVVTGGSLKNQSQENGQKMLIYAAQKAHQAANYILGIEQVGEE